MATRTNTNLHHRAYQLDAYKPFVEKYPQAATMAMA